jgi:hypothetical protein
MTSICSCGQRAVPAGRSSSPSETTPVFATAFVADLRYQPNTVPPPDGSERGCLGAATVWIDTTPRGIYQTGAAWFVVTLTACPPGTVVTNVYIARIDESGYDQWIGADLEEFVLRTGTETFSSTNKGIPMSRVDALLADPSGFAFRVATRKSPNGLLWGDLRRR